MDKLPYIAYNSSNNDRAKENRKKMTKAESKIRYEFLRHRPFGYKFLRQKPINSFILDFYCSKLLLGIEIDGGYHNDKDQKDYDKVREDILNQHNIKIIRYTNQQILNDLDDIKKSISVHIL